MSFAEQVKSSLLDVISEMAAHTKDFSKHPGTDFSRTRKLDFATLLYFIVSMEAGTVKNELLKFFSYDKSTVSNSAFFQQRAKLSEHTLPYLFHKFNCLYPALLYKGKYQLLAADGSSFTFTRNPSDPDSYFAPDGKTTRGYNQIHLIALFDLLSKRYTDSVVQPIRKKNEFRALCTLIDRFQPAPDSIPIFIADRGFHSMNVFAHAIEHHSYFMIRATDIKTQRLLAQDLPKGQDSFDVQVHRILTRTNSKKKRLHPELSDQYKLVYKNVAFDYIDAEKQTEYPITLRVLRFQISDNAYENIITNLPPEEFSVDEIKYLYSLRWGIETSFCQLKHVIGASNFHSKKREYIEMEIWARLLLYNFCSIITGHVVIKRRGRKHQLQVNYTVAYKACQYFLRLHGGESSPDIEGLIEKNTLPIRPNRKYARQHRFRVPVSFTYRFS